LLLAEYDLEVKYRAGKNHVNADCLSRYPEVNDVVDLDLDEEK
jgi:hypothetical protein